jgi:hypothetical protein
MISITDFKNQVEKLKEMFDIPPIEVPTSTMINHLFLEMREITRLQAERLKFQGINRVLMKALAPAFN